jgi:hypothetical protein
LEGATLELNDKVRSLSEISWSSPVYVPYGATLTLYVSCELEDGERVFDVMFNVPELGRVNLPFTDTVG